MISNPRYYAVKIGRKPGVYLTLEDRDAQTKGYPCSASKRFNNAEDAWDFVRQPASPPVQSHMETSTKPSTANIPDHHTIGSHSQPSIKRQLDDDDDDAILLTSSLPVVPGYTSDQSSIATIASAAEPIGEKSNRKKRRIDAPAPAGPSTTVELDGVTETFFTSLKYKNPTAFTKLAKTGFGMHELLSMKGHQPNIISSRFRNLLGRKAQSAAQVESLAFTVTHATEAAWAELEKQVQLH